MPLLNWNEDPEFSQLDPVIKKQAYDNFFDSQVDDEFRSLPKEQQAEIRKSFYQDEGLEDFKPIDTRSTLEKVGTAASRVLRSPAQGVGDLFKTYQVGLEGAKNRVDEMYGPAGQQFAEREKEALSKDIGRAEKVAKVFPDVESETPVFEGGIAGAVEQALVGVGRFAPAMAMAPAGAAPTFVQMFGMEYDRKRKEGLDHELSAETATLSSALQTPVEFLGNLVQLGGLGRIAKNVGLGKAVEGKLATVIGSIIQNATAEGVEEYVQQYAQNIADIYSKNPAATPDEIYQQFKKELPETHKQAVEAAKIGALGGGLLAGAGGVVAGGVNAMTKPSESVSQQPVDAMMAADAKIRDDIKNGTITVEQLQKERGGVPDNAPIAAVIDKVLADYGSQGQSEDAYWNEQQKEIERQRAERRAVPQEDLTDKRIKETARENQRKIGLEDARDVLTENRSAIDLINNAVSKQNAGVSEGALAEAMRKVAKPREDAEQGPARVRAKAEVEPLINDFMRRVEKHLPGEAAEISNEIEPNLYGMAPEDVKKATELVDPIIKNVIGRKARIEEARRAAAGNPAMMSVIDGVVKGLGGKVKAAPVVNPRTAPERGEAPPAAEAPVEAATKAESVKAEPSGKKPSEESLMNTLVEKGLVREQDRGKKMYEKTVRKIFPNDRWLDVVEAGKRLYKPSKDGSGAVARKIVEWADSGILERRWRKDGTPVYAWPGTDVGDTLSEKEIDEIVERLNQKEGENAEAIRKNARPIQGGGSERQGREGESGPDLQQPAPEKSGDEEKGKVKAEQPTAENTPLGSEAYIQAQKQPDGKFKLFYRGTRNEVFPGEMFNSARDARNYFKAKKAKRAASISAEQPSIKTGKTDKAYLNDNSPVEFDYAIVDAKDLVTSHNEDLTKNGAYPQALQPRDRGRDAMRLQIDEMVGKLNPERLGESKSVSSGAPIVGGDMVVESGNGRTIAIKKAYKSDRGSLYKKWLEENKEKFGIDSIPDGNPVLVRVRKGITDRAEFARKANQDEIARMSPAETAKADSARLKSTDWEIFSPSEDGNVAAASNKQFVSSFLAKLGTNETAGYLTADGGYTKQLVDRINAAVFYSAYRDENIVSMMAEEADPNIKNILNALTVAAGEFAKARAVDQNLMNVPVVDNIMAAVTIINRIRSTPEMNVKTFFQQMGLFDEIPIETQQITEFIDEHKRSAKKQGIFFKAVGRRLKNFILQRQNQSLPGFNPPDINIKELVNDAIEELNEKNQPELFGDADIQAGRQGRGEGVRRKDAISSTKEAEETYKIKDEDTYLSEKQALKFTQGELPFTGSRARPKAPKKVFSPTRTRMATTGYIAADGNAVLSAEDAASLLAGIRKLAQENVYTVTVDKNGIALEVHKYAKGTKNAASIAPNEMAGRVLNIPGAAKVYFVHNHPSGTTTPSGDDINIGKKTEVILKTRGIELENIIIAGREYAGFDGFAKKIRPSVRKVKVPVRERMIKSAAADNTVINAPEKAVDFIEKNFNGDNGVLFLSSKLWPAGFSKIKAGATVREVVADIIAKSEETNSVGVIINSSTPVDAPMRKAIAAVGDNIGLTVFDVIENGKSIGKPAYIAGALESAVRDNSVVIAIKRTLGNESGSALIASDIYNAALDLAKSTSTNFRKFRKAMRQRFADVWDKIKGFMRQLWDVVANERGSVNIEINKGQPEKTYLERIMEDPLYKQYVGKIEQTGGGMDIKELNKHSALFNWYNEKYGKGYVNRDMKWWSAAFNTPYGLTKKFPKMKELMNVELDAAEERNSLLFNDWDGDLAELSGAASKGKALLNELRNLIWQYDGKKIDAVKTPWFKKVGADEDLAANPAHYEQLAEFLRGKGYSEKAVNGFVSIRKFLDNKFIEIDKLYRSMEKPDPNMIDEFRTEIGKIHNYFPHRRTGDSFIQITNKEGKVVYREHYNSLNKFKNKPPQVQARAEKWLADAIAKGELEGRPSDYSFLKDKVEQLPDDVFFSIPTEAMHQIAVAAGTRVEGSLVEREAERIMAAGEASDIEAARKKARAKIKDDVSKGLAQAIAQTIQSRGWGRHAIPRKGTPGHETEDIFGILFDYSAGFAGFKTKIDRAKKHSEILRSIDAKKAPGLYRYASNYVKDMLANQDKVDRAVDRLRGIFFVRYLGFVVKSGLVNLTQNAVLAAPRLSVDTKMAHTKLSIAMADTRMALTSKAAWTNKEVTYPGLKPIEQTAMRQLHEEGASNDVFVRELQGNMPGVGWSKYMKKAVRMGGMFMSVAEKFNRSSTGLAAFRVGYNEKFSNLPDSERYSRSIEFAKEIINDSHFVYGKHNMPAWARGGPARKWFRSAYTFRSFSHNYIAMMTHMLLNQGWAGKMAFARSLRNIFLLGGLTSIPFFKLASEMLYKIMGKDDDDPLTDVRKQLPETWMRDLVVYGLPGVGGVDISGSLSIEVPRSWVDIIGIPYAMYEDTINTYKSWKSGQRLRAISETPFTPISVRNALRGLELYEYGQFTRSGRAINEPDKATPYKLTGVKAFKKGVLGLQDVELSKGYAAYKAVDKLPEKLENKKKEFADRYANAIQRNDPEALKAVQDEIIEWNQKQIERGRPYMVIDPMASIINRLQPSIKFMDKKLRGNALEVYGAWR